MEFPLRPTLYSEGIEGQYEGARRLSDLSKREGERQNGNRDEKRRKRSNLVGPPGDSTGEFYNEVRSGGRFTFFQPPICAREAKWEHFKDGKALGEKRSRRQWGGQTSSCDGRVPSRTSFAVAFSHDCRHSFFLPTLFSPDEKCNRAHDSDLLNFAEAARSCAKRSRCRRAHPVTRKFSCEIFFHRRAI